MHRILSILIAATFTCVILRTPAAEAGAEISDFSADVGQGKKQVRQVVDGLENSVYPNPNPALGMDRDDAATPASHAACVRDPHCPRLGLRLNDHFVCAATVIRSRRLSKHFAPAFSTVSLVPLTIGE